MLFKCFPTIIGVGVHCRGDVTVNCNSLAQCVIFLQHLCFGIISISSKNSLFYNINESYLFAL